MGKAVITLLLFVGLMAPGFSNPPSRFQADKFLDMLARTFDSKVAYLDLLSALQRRLNLDPMSNATGSGTPVDGTAGTGAVAPPAEPPCPESEYRPGSTITYTPISRTVGSRAFYECNKGFSGRSLFIQCMSGGQWSPILGWEGCQPINCGPAPQIANGDASPTSSTFGSVAVYTCRSGFKLDTPTANVTCQESGRWSTPGFKCDKVATTPPPQPANNGFNMAALAALMSSMAGGEGGSPAGGPNPMLAAMMKAGMPGMSGQPMMGGSAGQPTGGTTNVMDMIQMLAGGFQPAAPPTTTTTTPAPPTHNAYPSSFGPSPGGFQLPNHLKNLLPNGLSNAQGFKPHDLVALTSAGLGSATGGTGGPQDITSLLSAMNPMAMLTPGGMGGQSPAGPGGRGRMPMDPEKMAEQREEMMMRAMMANAMKSMMGGGQQQGNGTSQNNDIQGDLNHSLIKYSSGGQQQGNGTSQNNGGGMNNMLAMMALQNGLGGGGGGGGAGFDAMLPMMMGGGMGGMMGGMGGGAGGLLSGLFGGA